MDLILWISSIGKLEMHVMQPEIKSLASGSHFCAPRCVQEQETVSETCF